MNTVTPVIKVGNIIVTVMLLVSIIIIIYYIYMYVCLHTLIIEQNKSPVTGAENRFIYNSRVEIFLTDFNS